jgi:Ni/Co efflux regulator RcnB
MTLFKTASRFLAAAAAASLVIAPVAQADRDRGGQGGDRGGWERRGDDYRGHRGWDDRREYWRDDRGHGHKHKHKHYYYTPAYRPVVVYPPAYPYYPRSTVTVTYGYSYGPYYYSGYTPRYSVGHYYSYAPRRTVYIHDYDRYGLYAPPSGYHWVRDNDRGDAILASVATGAIIGLVVGALISD